MLLKTVTVIDNARPRDQYSQYMHENNRPKKGRECSSTSRDPSEVPSLGRQTGLDKQAGGALGEVRSSLSP